MPNDFFSKCSPLTRTGIDNCSGLTLCNLSPTTADELDDIYKDTSGRWRIMGSLLETDIVAKAANIQENPLYTFIRAYAEDWGTAQIGTRPRGRSGLVDVMPFIIVDRDNHINVNYWKWTFSAGSGTAPNGKTYDIRGIAESQTGIPASDQWFPDNIVVHISGVSAGGTATKTKWLVIDSAVSGNTTVLYLRSQNAASSLSGAKLGTPASGVLVRGLNNISPYESHCDQIPKLNTKSTFLAFMQSTRWSLCNDEITAEYLRLVMEGNPLYKKYYHVEQQEFNRQVTADFQNRMVHEFLFGKSLPNQTEELWPNLEVIESFTDGSTGNYIYLPNVEGKCVGRRASVKGVYEQLAECGRVVDLQGDVVNFPELQTALYELYRARKSSGVPNPEIIEVITDSAYKVQFVQAMYRYLKARSEDTIRFAGDMSEKTTQLGFAYQDFKLDYPAGVTLRVVSHIALDDFVNAGRLAGGAALENASRWMLILDWSTIKMANIQSDSVDLRTGDIKRLAEINGDAFCRMKVPQRSIKHYSLLFTVIVTNPLNSLWLENFSFAVPEHQNKYGNPNLGQYTDYAGNDPSND